MNPDELYDNIDEEEGMSDLEKRETYFSEIEDDQDHEDWTERGYDEC